MKIGIDARLYWQTGVGRYIRNLLHFLYILDRENQYVIFTNKDFSSARESFPRWEIQNVDIKWHTFSEQTIFPLIIAKSKLDLLHFPYFSVPIFYPGKFVVTIHDLTNLYFTTGRASHLPYPVYLFKHLSYRLVLKTVLTRAERLIVPSKTIASEISQIDPSLKKKIVVTYEAPLTEITKKQTRLSFEPFLLYVGNLYPHKNIENALLAVKKFNESYTQKVNFVIVSQKDFFLDRVRKFVQKINLGDQVFFIENVSDSALSNLYSRAVCLLFSSISEGFGLPALEAMQHGCLIAASDLPIFHEICENLPFYFDPYNVCDMAKTVKKIISLDRSQKKVLQNKEKKRASYFSWAKTAKQTLKAYQEVAK